VNIKEAAVTIDEAIKRLTGLLLGDPEAEMSDFQPAIKLGIEALKAWKGLPRPKKILPGED
jgi:hypothetical protein